MLASSSLQSSHCVRTASIKLPDFAYPLPTHRRGLLWFAIAGFTIIVLLFTWQEEARLIISPTFHSLADDSTPQCRNLPGAEGVVVVMKTGANKVEDNLAVHLRNTLTCYPHLAIFFDYEEDLVSGHHLFDCFMYTSTILKEGFRLVASPPRKESSQAELSGAESREESEDIRKQVPGWQLDKWKFLPMVNQTLGLFPDKHWYVFVEADTYLLWSDLLGYLAPLSWADDHYIGSRAVIEELGFAHGGSGFLLSRPALEKVSALFTDHQEEWEDFNDQYWVGDHILAAAPTWQGQPLNLLNFSRNDGLWCSPAMTFHHQTPAEIESLWSFEQEGIATRNQSAVLRHRDLLERYVMPQIQSARWAWDNRADNSQTPEVASLSQCEVLCEEDANCMQYALYKDEGCKTTSRVIFGESNPGVQSGWMLQRIRRSLDESGQCLDEE